MTVAVDPDADRDARPETASQRSSFASLGVIAATAAWANIAATGGLQDRRLATVLCLLTAVMCGYAILVRVPRGQWSMSFLTFLTLAVFHVGMFASIAMNGQLSSAASTEAIIWTSQANMSKVASYVALGLSSFALGSILWGGGPIRSSFADQNGDRSVRETIAIGGAILLTVGTAYWLVVNVQIGGATFFLQPYESYLAWTAGSRIGLAYIGIGIGLPMVAQWLDHPVSRVGAASFLLFALIGFPLGLRGEVLFPLVSAVAVYMYFRERRPRWTLATGTVALLLLITAARQIRHWGLAGLGGAEVSLNPIEAAEELGGTVRVLATSVSWHEGGTQPYAMGETYVSPIVRYLNTILGMSNPEGSADHRLFNVEILERVGAIGGSVLAEAHHNFWWVGLLVVPLLWGALIGGLAKHANSPISVAWMGLVGLLFSVHVRDASTHLAVWLLVGSVMILLCQMAAGLRSGRRV